MSLSISAIEVFDTRRSNVPRFSAEDFPVGLGRPRSPICGGTKVKIRPHFFTTGFENPHAAVQENGTYWGTRQSRRFPYGGWLCCLSGRLENYFADVIIPVPRSAERPLMIGHTPIIRHQRSRGQ
jgi:hypothetical protein